jgi:hypothetical protein
LLFSFFTCLGDSLMSCTKNGLVGIVALAIGTLVVGSSIGAPITVLNNSFETPSLDDNGEHQTFDAAGVAWVPSATGRSIWNPDGVSFPGAAGNGTPVGGDGANILYLLGPGDSFVSNTLSGVFEAGTYTLTVAVGNLVGVGNARDFTFGLGLAPESYLGSFSGDFNDIPVGSLTDLSAQIIVSPGDPSVGQAIVITLAGTGGGFVTFDNVRLDLQPIPEPSTGALAVFAFVGCSALLRRRSRNSMRS